MSINSKIVNVVLNSNNAITGSTTQSANYFMNWGAILEDNTPYYLHFTYIGGKNIIDGTNLATVYANFNTSNKFNTSSTQSASSTTMLGFLKPIVFVGSSSSGYLQAEDNTNVPTYLSSRPQNNTFNISIFDNAATPALYKDQTPTTPANPAAYIIVLSFRKVNEDD
jgi:hypothetical protein